MNSHTHVDTAARISELRELIAAARRDETELRNRLANPNDTMESLTSRVAEREEALRALQDRREAVERRLSECGAQYKSEMAYKESVLRTLQEQAQRLCYGVAANADESAELDGGDADSRAVAVTAFAADAARAREDDIVVQRKTLRELQAAVDSVRALVTAAKEAQSVTRRTVTAQRDAKIATAVEALMHGRHALLMEISNVQRINAQYVSVLRHRDPAKPTATADASRGTIATKASGAVAAPGQEAWLLSKHHQMRVEADKLRDAVATMQTERATLRTSMKDTERLWKAKKLEWSGALQRLQKETVAAKAHTARLVQNNTRMTREVQKLRETLSTLTAQRQQLIGNVAHEDF